MKVVLLKDIKGTGKKGELKEVSDGHARNYLIPKGLAREANESAVRELRHQQKSLKKRLATELAEAKELAEKIEKLKLIFEVKAGDGGRLFGSVTSKDVAEKLENEFKIDVDRKKIDVDGGLKTLGLHNVKAKLYTGVDANIKVEINEK